MKTIVLLFLFLLICSPCFAATYYVDDDAADDTGAGTEGDPWKTIQKASDTVSAGDTVIVEDGTYTDENEDGYGIRINSGASGSEGNWVTFKSRNKWGAKIDGQDNAGGSYGFFLFNNVEYIRIEDFEILGWKWAGAFIGNGVTAHHIYFYRNWFHDIGVWCDDCTVCYGHEGVYQGTDCQDYTYDSNIFETIGRLAPGEEGCGVSTDHAWNHDHGIYMNGDSGLIINNLFINMYAGWGVAIANGFGGNFWWKSDLKIINNTFIGNNPGRIGQIINRNKNVTIENNISIGCTTSINYPSLDIEGNGISGSAFVWDYEYSSKSHDNLHIRNNITESDNLIAVWNTVGVTTFPGYAESDNLLSTDPLVVDKVGTDLADLDLQLQASSSAIDAGLATNAPAVDYVGTSRPQPPEGLYDVGAYESTAAAEPEAPSAVRPFGHGIIIITKND